MYTVIQQGEQDNTFYTLQVNGKDLDHFTTLEAACIALEGLKTRAGHPLAVSGMERWYPAGKGEYVE